jgi:hypothetical protein
MKASVLQRQVITVCAFVVAATGAAGESMLAATSARAALDFRINIPTVVRAENRTDPFSIAVTAGDVRQGYLDLEEASTLVLTSNSATGFAMSVAFDRRIVRSVELRVAGHTLSSSQPGDAIAVLAPRIMRKPLRVSYRLYLLPGVEPGAYDWPLSVSYFPLGA